MSKLLGSIFLLAFCLNLSAATLNNIAFDDKVSVEGKELVLNGIGIRKATILRIKVYYGALYLNVKSKDPSIFLASPAPKQIIMHFVHAVDAKKLRNAFTEGMEAANKNHVTFKLQMDKFNSYITDVAKDDLIVITFTIDSVLLSVKGKPVEKIMGSDFSHALLSIWFINPRDEGLRDGLLGF